jgi:hypothetical protein
MFIRAKRQRQPNPIIASFQPNVKARKRNAKKSGERTRQTPIALRIANPHNLAPRMHLLNHLFRPGVQGLKVLAIFIRNVDVNIYRMFPVTVSLLAINPDNILLSPRRDVFFKDSLHV